MASISTNEAAANLQRLLDRVARGEEITLVSGNLPVARIVPVDTSAGPAGITPEDAVQRLRDFGKGHFLGSVDIRSLIEEGRA